MSRFQVGDRISFQDRICTVGYIGNIGNVKGERLGVEWDDPTLGRHSGEHEGVKYFECGISSSRDYTFRH